MGQAAPTPATSRRSLSPLRKRRRSRTQAPRELRHSSRRSQTRIEAAFPAVDGHAVHDNAVNYFVLFDQLEWQAGDGASGLSIDSRGWVGRGP